MMTDAMTERPSLEATVHAHQANLWRYARMLGCDPAQAEDLCQEAFLRVFQSDFEARSFEATSAYLRTTIRNLWLNLLKREKRKLELGPIEEAERTWLRYAADAHSDLRLAALDQCLETLDERQRKALDLRYRESQEGDEIARRMGLSHAAVRQLLTRARAALQDCIERRLEHVTD